MRTVVVLPFVPVTETTGIRAGTPGGYRLSTTAAATSRGWPSVGDRCIRRPGHAFSSSTAHGWAGPRPAGSCSGAAMSASRRSMPQMSSPDSAAARRHMSATSACTRSVTSLLVPPVDRFALRRSVTALPVGRHRMVVQSERVQVAERVGIEPDLGQLARVTGAPARIGCWPPLPAAPIVRAPSPVTAAGRSCAAAATLAVDDQDPVVRAGHELPRRARRRRRRRPSRRRPLPVPRCARRSSGCAPWLPPSGLTTTGAPSSASAAAASSADHATTPAATGMPGRGQQLLGQLLVSGDVDSDG